MKPLGEVLQRSAAYLEERKVERARRLAEELLAAVLKLQRLDLYMQFDRPIIEDELLTLRDWLKRCGKGEPVEYVVGQVDFLDCKISVDSRVLIPRPETEILVDLIIKTLKERPLDGKVCWDICTGSGCIGIALKKALPTLNVVLSDLSEAALTLAGANAKSNGVEIELKKGDLFAPFENLKVDFFVSNPPYIASSEYLKLSPSVACHEPKMALVGGERGTEFYERMAAELPRFLNAGGLAFFEIGFDQGEAVKKIFAGGPWAFAEGKKDWAGHDRFFFLEKQ
jgi:release factor glutamine methyltransferase